MTGYIYVITEGSPPEIAEYRAGVRSPTYYKVGRALESKAKELTPVEFRLSCLQSCTTEPLAAVRVFAFDTKSNASRVEAEFKRTHTAKFGVRLYRNHEWFHGTLPIAAVTDWMLSNGARDATSEHSDREVQGRYEIDYGTIDLSPPRGSPRYGTTIRLLEFTHKTTWQKLVACRYSEDVTLAAYWTGSPRPIAIIDRIQSPTPNSANYAWEEQVAEVLAAHLPTWQSVEHSKSTAPRLAGNRTPWRYTGWILKPAMEPIFSSIRDQLCGAR